MEGKPYSFVNVESREQKEFNGSYYNVKEVEAVVDLVKELRDKTVAAGSSSPNWNSPDKIRIITFYSAQVSSIQRALRNAGISVTVSTVDSSQGCEADIVIVSFVRSRDSDEQHSIGFVKDERRINVAITRARYQLVCVGNTYGTLHREDGGVIKDLITNAIERKHVAQKHEEVIIESGENESEDFDADLHREIRKLKASLSTEDNPTRKKLIMLQILVFQETVVVARRHDLDNTFQDM